MNKRYVVRLTTEEREHLEELVAKGKAAAYRIRHAHLLLAVDADGPNWTDAQASKAFRCHGNTVANVRRRLVEGGLDAALERKKQDRPSRPRVLDGDGEARLIAIACGQAPAGRAKWTMQLLADQLVALNVVERISPKTVERTLKKTNCGRTCASIG
jgi:transposase